MWVAAHCLSLPGHWGEAWELLLGCLDELLVKGTAVIATSRMQDMMGSAVAGNLLKTGRTVGWRWGADASEQLAACMAPSPCVTSH